MRSAVGRGGLRHSSQEIVVPSLGDGQDRLPRVYDRRSYMISLWLFIPPHRIGPKPADPPGASGAITGHCSRKASPQRPNSMRAERVSVKSC